MNKKAYKPSASFLRELKAVINGRKPRKEINPYYGINLQPINFWEVNGCIA